MSIHEPIEMFDMGWHFLAYSNSTVRRRTTLQGVQQMLKGRPLGVVQLSRVQVKIIGIYEEHCRPQTCRILEKTWSCIFGS